MIKYIRLILIACLAAGFASPLAAMAASANAGLSISANVSSFSNLTLGSTTLTFVADDPTIQATVPAQENPVAVSVRVRTKGSPTLTVIANDDLKDGASIIPVSAITWSADSTPFIAGAISKSSAQAAATFPVGSGNYVSAFRYALANSTSYLPGNYATNISYTLTAP